MAADEAEPAVAHHRTWKQTSLQQNLEPVTDAQNHSAALGEFLDRLHHRRKTRDRSRTQVIAISKTAWQDNGVTICEILRLMPNEFNGLVQNVPDGVKRVVVAIGPGENDDSEFHCALAP
jgi:hypothetical protein